MPSFHIHFTDQETEAQGGDLSSSKGIMAEVGHREGLCHPQSPCHVSAA